MSTPMPGYFPIALEDVMDCLESSAAGFAQLAALLKAIQEKSPDHSDAAKLAALGWSVACDLEGFAGSTLEQMQKGGVQS